MSPVRRNKPHTVHRVLYDLRSRRSRPEPENPLVPLPPSRPLVYGRTVARTHTHTPPSRSGVALAGAQSSDICADVGQAIRDGMAPKAIGFEIKRKFALNCEDFARAVYEEQGKIILALKAREAVPHKRMQAMFPEGTSNCVEDCIILAMVAVDSMMRDVDIDPLTTNIKKATLRTDDIADAVVKEDGELTSASMETAATVAKEEDIGELTLSSSEAVETTIEGDNDVTA